MPILDGMLTKTEEMRSKTITVDPEDPALTCRHIRVSSRSPLALQSGTAAYKIVKDRTAAGRYL